MAREFTRRCNRSIEALVPIDEFHRSIEVKLDLNLVRPLLILAGSYRNPSV